MSWRLFPDQWVWKYTWVFHFWVIITHQNDSQLTVQWKGCKWITGTHETHHRHRRDTTVADRLSPSLSSGRKICSTVLDRQCPGLPSSSGFWYVPRISPRHLNRAPPGDVRGRPGERSWAPKQTPPKHRIPFWGQLPRDCGSVRPKSWPWEEPSSHACKQTAPWNLLLRNEKKPNHSHVSWSDLKICKSLQTLNCLSLFNKEQALLSTVYNSFLLGCFSADFYSS